MMMMMMAMRDEVADGKRLVWEGVWGVWIWRSTMGGKMLT